MEMDLIYYDSVRILPFVLRHPRNVCMNTLNTSIRLRLYSEVISFFLSFPHFFYGQDENI